MNEKPDAVFTEIYRLNRENRFMRIVQKMKYSDSMRLKVPFQQNANHSWYCIGDAYFKAKRYQLAADAFRRALRSNANDAEAWLALGNSYNELGKPTLAARVLQKGLPLPAKHHITAAIRYNLGNALFDLARYAEAAEKYRQVSRRTDEIGRKAKLNLALIKSYKENKER